MTTDQTPQPTQRTVAGADGPPPSKAADQPKPRTAVTHASGPRKDSPVVAGRCPACNGASLFLGNGHVTCARLDCPDPTAADDQLHGGRPLANVAELLTKLGAPDVPTAYGQAHQLSGRVWELAGDMEPDDPDALRGSLLEKATALLSEGADGVFQREQWTAALRHVAPLAGADPQTAPRTVLLALAQEIEDGTITPWDAVRASGPRAGQPVEPADLGQPVAVLEVAVLEDQLCRRVWAAALRWEAGQMHPGRLEGAGERGYFAACLEIDAERIETGDLTPWADHPAEPALSPSRVLTQDQVDEIVGDERPRLAEPAPEPDSGPGWNRDSIGKIAKHMLTPELRAEVLALLADRDRLSVDLEQAEDRIALAQTAAAEAERGLEHARADRQDLWATRDKRNHRWMDAAERLTEERDAARAEAERQRQRADTATGKVVAEHLAWQQMLDRAEAAEARLEEAERDRDRYRATLPAEVQDYWHWRGVAERLERELATARRDAAADFGTWLDRGRVIGYLVDGQRYHPGNVQIVMEANDER